MFILFPVFECAVRGCDFTCGFASLTRPVVAPVTRSIADWTLSSPPRCLLRRGRLRRRVYVLLMMAAIRLTVVGSTARKGWECSTGVDIFICLADSREARFVRRVDGFGRVLVEGV
jgi:hypothetical protein